MITLPEKPRRRRFQPRYSLATLFVVVTVFGVWLGVQVKWTRDRRVFLEDRYYLPGESSPDAEPTRAPRVLWLFSAQPIYLVNIYGHAEAQQAASLFPEAILLDMEGIERNPPP